jgi:hypothetical protein
MDQDRYKPPFRVLPGNAVSSAAAALVQEARGEHEEREERLQSEFFGQQAGVPGMGDAPALYHEPGASVLANKLLHPAFQIMEREFRALPEQGWFAPEVNPKRPIEFQLGAYQVPRNQVLWLTDYQFQVFRPSGVDPGDFVVAAPGRFSNQMGFDISVRGKRQSNISYQLDPQPVFEGRPEFQPQITPPSGGGFAGPGPGTGASDPFNNAAARTFASTASPGTSLLPRRPNVQGPRGGPFTFVIGESAAVGLNVVIFNSLTSPVAAIGGRVAGYLIHTNLSSALLQRVRPR